MKGMTKAVPSGISYAGKVVLVTGAASGIGRAMAVAFGRAGACVVVADTAVDGGHMTAALIVEGGGKALFVKANVTVAAEVDALVDKAVSHYGRIDCAVNSAAVEEEYLPLAEGEDAQFERIMNVNVKGVWLCMKSQLRQMLKQEGGGVIVNVADAARPGRGAGPRHLRRVQARGGGADQDGGGGICQVRHPHQQPVPGGGEDADAGAHARARSGARQEAQGGASDGAVCGAGRGGQCGLVAVFGAGLFVTGHQLAIDGGLTAIDSRRRR
jgi:NAD(P)-dependent dehydrogenase (short-subunit alcohol dehydrogenase family)